MGADLWPHDARQIEITRQFSWNQQHFTLRRRRALAFREHRQRSGSASAAPDPAVVEEALGEFRRWAAVLNERLKGRTWLVGDRITVADFSVAMVLPFAGGGALAAR